MSCFLLLKSHEEQQEAQIAAFQSLCDIFSKDFWEQSWTNQHQKQSAWYWLCYVFLYLKNASYSTNKDILYCFAMFSSVQSAFLLVTILVQILKVVLNTFLHP